MVHQIILASGSEIRATLLRNAGVSFDVVMPRVDEENLKMSLIAEERLRVILPTLWQK